MQYFILFSGTPCWKHLHLYSAINLQTYRKGSATIENDNKRRHIINWDKILLKLNL